MLEKTPEVEIVTLEIVPEQPDNLAYHVGNLQASHESMRREWEAQREEVAQMRALHQTLLDELQTVEEVVTEIQAEDTTVEESAVVDDPQSHPPEKRRHWLLRSLTGH